MLLKVEAHRWLPTSKLKGSVLFLKRTMMKDQHIKEHDQISASACHSIAFLTSSRQAADVFSNYSNHCRYAVAFSLPKGAAQEGVFYELSTPPRIVRVSKTEDGKLQLIVSGEEHDQGIPAADFQDYFAGYCPPCQALANADFVTSVLFACSSLIVTQRLSLLQLSGS